MDEDPLFQVKNMINEVLVRQKLQFECLIKMIKLLPMADQGIRGALDQIEADYRAQVKK